MQIRIKTENGYYYSDVVAPLEESAVSASSESSAAGSAARKEEIGKAQGEFQKLFDDAIDALGNQKGSVTSEQSLDEIFTRASKKYGVDKQLLLAVAMQESRFGKDATSKSGAMGIMQLMPYTAEEMGVKDAYDPEQNIMGGTKLLKILLDKYNGNKELALAAYNAGSNAVDKYGGIPPYTETQNYVKYVMGFYKDKIQVPDDATYTKTTSYKTTAKRLKKSFADFSEHDSYNTFLKNLSDELKTEGSAKDAEDAYRILLKDAKAAIDQTIKDRK